MLVLAKRFLNKIRRFIARERAYAKYRRVVSIETDKTYRGRMLLSYLIEPFLLEPDETIPHDHTRYWECRQIAETFLDLGYSVDVISYHNRSFQPTKDYAFFIDLRWNMQRLARELNRDCIKISHHDTAHILFHDTAELKRLLQLQTRRGVTLSPWRFEMPNGGIEYADYATVLGNDFTIGTYRFAGKPIYRIPISTPVLYPWPENKDFGSTRRRFIWLSSGGMVHKGLDLLLEAFSQMPNYELYVCGPVQEENEFVHVYFSELYRTPNIHVIGWVDIASDKFKQLTDNCIGLVYASCSEGGGGAVLTCMHAGLIPIASLESSVDINEDFGVLLRTSSIEEIIEAVTTVANHPVDRLQQMSRKAWEFARSNHTRENFAEVYRSVIEQIIKKSAR